MIPSDGRSGRWQVSVAGGTWPRWRRDSRELFYVAADGALMSVAVGPGAAFAQAPPRALFTPRLRRDAYMGYASSYPYDVSPDGQRFLVNSPVDSSTAELSLVINWPAILTR